MKNIRSGVQFGRLFAEMHKYTDQVFKMHKAIFLWAAVSGIARPKIYQATADRINTKLNKSQVVNSKIVSIASHCGCLCATNTYLVNAQYVQWESLSKMKKKKKKCSPSVCILKVVGRNTKIIMDIGIGKKSADNEITLIISKHAQNSAPRSISIRLTTFHILRAECINLREI